MKPKHYSVIIMLMFVTVVLVAVLTGCANPTDAGNGGQITPVTLSPPGWIIGSWSDEFFINNYTFSSNNVVWSVGGSSVDFQQLNNDWAAQGEAGSGFYDSTPSSTNYTIEVKDNYTIILTYGFEQKSATTLDYSIDGGGAIELIKQ